MARCIASKYKGTTTENRQWLPEHANGSPCSYFPFPVQTGSLPLLGHPCKVAGMDLRRPTDDQKAYQELSRTGAFCPSPPLTSACFGGGGRGGLGEAGSLKASAVVGEAHILLIRSLDTYFPTISCLVCSSVLSRIIQ